MRVLIIGYGSMGRRRIRLITELVPEADIFCVDQNMERLKAASQSGVKGYQSIADGIARKPDVAFVCTSPGNHADIILQLIHAGVSVFTELNLVGYRYDEILMAAEEKNVLVFMSSTLLYKLQMQIFKELVSRQDKPLTYVYHVGQYLPDWHPWEDYKNFFVGKKETNGVREILAVQLPWIVNVFGKVADLYSEKAKTTHLDIDYPDSIITTLKHINGTTGVFVADVVSRKAMTRLEIIGEDLHLVWDGHNDDLYKMDLNTHEMKPIPVYKEEEHIDGYSDNIAEQPYREEIREFLLAFEGKATPRYSLRQDAYILSLIDEIEGIRR